MRLKRFEVPPKDRWVKVTDKKFRMNTLLKKQLDLMTNVVEYDSDMMLLVDGEIEGTGKSTLAQQIGYYFAWKSNTKFSIDNIVFTPKQLKDALESTKKFSVYVWDEAYAGANKYRIMAQENQEIISIFQKIRQRNLFLIVVLPSFFDLAKYFAVRRSWALIHCYLQPQIDIQDTEDNVKLDLTRPVLQKGYFKYFTRPLKKHLYTKYKKDEDYSNVKARFIGMFPPTYTIKEEDYKAKKAQITEEEGVPERVWIEGCLQRDMPIPLFKDYSSYARETLYQIKKKIGL